MTDTATGEVPQTIEGWYTLHDVYRVDWPRLKALPAERRDEVVAEASAWIAEAAAVERGDTKAYSVVGHKGDLMLVHYRESPAVLGSVERSFRGLDLADLLVPAYSYLSVIEVSLYEVQAMAVRRVMQSGLERGTSEFDAALADEFEKQKERMGGRLWRDVPEHGYICFYPMNKRRGETVNWYALPLEDRRALMRKHGSIGHKYHEVVTQIIGGSVGLDDWEWGVSLHSDDPLVFKKLIYEMRFDPASALYAEFGPFYVGTLVAPDALGDSLTG